MAHPPLPPSTTAIPDELAIAIDNDHLGFIAGAGVSMDSVSELAIDFELRIIQGNYKPDLVGDRPLVLAHLGVFTDELYMGESAVKRWGWAKYPCEVEVGRLRRLAPASQPTVADLLHGPRGVVEKFREVQAGSTTMIEWVLPTLEHETQTFDDPDPRFAEFCHGATATSARHHARLLGHAEADRLGNDEFFPWYHERVFATSSLLPLAELKRRARDEGSRSFAHQSRVLAGEFLEALRLHLDAAP